MYGTVCLWLVLVTSSLVASQDCYWNRQCAYQLYSSKTPYDTVRGDIRDFPVLEGCEAISLWSLNRHGNRNPGNSVTTNIRNIGQLKDQIIASFEAGTSQLCAQDIDEFRKWTWNDTMDVSQSFLTGIGYEELYDMAQRIRSKYPQLLQSTNVSSYYFKPTTEQRTIASAMAFTHGLSDGLDLNMTIDEPEDDNVIRPYSNCERYQIEVRGDDAPVVAQLESFQNTAAYTAIQNGVQNRLGIAHQITREEVYYFYEICRFFRSWTPTLQSPWCSVFSDEDLMVLEYRDDIRHYYRNGFANWMNIRLGQPILGDLYTTFAEAIEGSGRTITSYFSHDTMLQMAFSAAGLYRDDFTLVGDTMVPNRLWRTSNFAAFSTNLIAVLNRSDILQTEELVSKKHGLKYVSPVNERCGSTTPSYRVQVFINEKESEICPLTGCTWEEFQDKFQQFANSNIDFCSLDYVVEEINSGVMSRCVIVMLAISVVLARIL